MEYVADLHVHSKYSRAVSRDMTLPVMDLWAKKKGINILTTADWTHPLWFREIREQLVEESPGLFKLKTSAFAEVFDPESSDRRASADKKNSKDEKETLFLLSTEISSIYSQGGKVRRIHNLVFSPSFTTCEKISSELKGKGCNLMADGRPIIGLSSRQLIELVLSVDEKALLVPCHAWTPWFSLYGSNSGFDSIEECFGEFSKYIYAVETGLSSDPEMNWRIKELENRSIISSSDSHSPAKMGREATVFKAKNEKNSFEITYQDIISAIKQDPESNLRIRYTIEFHPEEGKYHYTGHRNCKVKQSPEETKVNGIICPVCKKPLTIGVMHRVEQLAQYAQSSHLSKPDTGGGAKIRTQNDKYGVKWYGDPSGKHSPYVKLVPLLEIIAESLSSTVASIKVKDTFDNLCAQFNSEINILLKTPIEEIEKVNPRVAEGILKVRGGNIVVDPGFDGEYGKVKIWNNDSNLSSDLAENILENEIKVKKKESQMIIEF